MSDEQTNPQQMSPEEFGRRIGLAAAPIIAEAIRDAMRQATPHEPWKGGKPTESQVGTALAKVDNSPLQLLASDVADIKAMVTQMANWGSSP